VHSQINKLNKIGLFCCNLSLSTSKFEFDAVCWSAAGMNYLKPKLSDFLIDLHQSLAYKGFAKILDISMGMPAVCANLSASRSQHISSQKSLNLG
jgi:hypothetical protein